MEILDREFLVDILDSMVWSFSRLNSFNGCKRAWYYNYILQRGGKDNFFSQYGNFFHGIMEKYNKGELEIYDLLDYYDNNFDEAITMSAPPNAYVDLRESYYNKGRKYLEDFNGYSDKVLGAEVGFSFTRTVLGKERTVVGYIDRVSYDNNGIIVTDYKSKSKFKSKEELRDYTRQLYMYSKAIKDMYGEFPYMLIFDQFKDGKETKIRFNKDDFDETNSWIDNTIKSIYDESIFAPKEDIFFCSFLCGVGQDVCSI